MAVESKTINTRLVLRNDTLANWEGSDKVLLKGEAALAFDGSIVKMLIGDGEKSWSQLSGDASTIGNIKFGTGNILGLETYVSDKETNTTYQLISAALETGETGKSYKLQKKEKGDESWTDVTGSRFNIPQFDPSTLQSEIDAISVQVSSFSNTWKEGVDTAIGTTIPKDISDALSSAKAYTDTAEQSAKSYTDALCATLSTAVSAEYVKYTDLNSQLTGGNKVATMSDIVGLSGSVHILGTIANDPTTGEKKSDQSVIVATYPNAKRGAIVINTTNGKEYICMAEIGATATESDWIEIGDEKIYATKAELKTVSDNLDSLSGKYDTFVGTTYVNDKTAISAYVDTVSAWLSGDYYGQISAENTRAEGVEGGLRTDLNTVSGDLDMLEGKALTGVVINGVSADITTTANVAEFSISCINCGGANG